MLLRTPDSRKLATLLAHKDYVATLDVRDGEALTVHTDDPNKLLEELPATLVDNGIACSEISSPDDNLEAVFGYLTGR